MKLDREKFIEAVGINATDKIQDCLESIEQIEKYFDLIRVFQVTGWHYEKAMRPPVEALKAIE